MRWLRNRRFGSCLALAALALQFVLSFGHLHLDGVRRADPAIAFAGPAAHAAQSLAAPQPDTEENDDYCAICATIYLVANSFTPAAPQLRVPLVCRTIEQFDCAAGFFIAPRRAPFQSRAPPLA
ncbi:MAG TPA: hypothetical protein VEK75_15835 [Xanthobacteraceae bacterium]|nr:hypothetical protein [Xanthobacteraceae bacterium]